MAPTARKLNVSSWFCLSGLLLMLTAGLLSQAGCSPAAPSEEELRITLPGCSLSRSLLGRFVEEFRSDRGRDPETLDELKAAYAPAKDLTCSAGGEIAMGKEEGKIVFVCTLHGRKMSETKK